MISREIYEEAVKRTLMFFEKAGIVLTDEEKGNVEVADFGLTTWSIPVLSWLPTSIQIVYVQRSWCCFLTRGVQSIAIRHLGRTSARKRPSAAMG